MHAEFAVSWQAPQSDAFLSLSLRQGTVRQTVTVHGGGGALRLRLGNACSTRPVTLGAASIAHSKEMAWLASQPMPLTFQGERSVVIPPGQSVLSDPVALAVTSMDRLAVSLFVSHKVLSMSRHFTGNERAWTAAGDQTLNVDGQGFAPHMGALNTSIFLLDRLEVLASVGQTSPRHVVAAFGDSLTDGFMCDPRRPWLPGDVPIGQDVRYPDFLQRRANEAGVSATFFSAAISGNRLLSGPVLPSFGPSGLSRLSRDVVSAPGVTDAIVLIGSNDLGFAFNPGTTGRSLQEGLTTVVQTLRKAGIRALVGTLPPAGGASFGMLHGRRSVEVARQTLNTWIRTSRVADAVVDFDACLRDPQSPDRMLAQHDSGDRLHPNGSGYAAMAACVDLGLFGGSA